jgi:hypothetical protein
MKKALFFTLSTLLISLGSFAQSWNLTGNNNATSTSILGTTNSVPVRVFTKNLVRLTIDTFGFVGINSAHPVSTLDVRGTQFLNGVLKFGTGAHGLQFANPTSTANKAMMYMFTSGTTNLPRMVIAHSTAFPNFGLQYDDNTDNFIFTDGSTQKVSIALGSGSVNMTGALGVGSANIFGNTTIYGNTTIGATANINGGANIFGGVAVDDLNATNSVSGGTGPKPFASGIYANGNGSRYNIVASNTDNGHWWGIWTSNTHSLNLYLDASFRGSFDPTTGAYTSISDARLKINVKPMESVLDKIIQLKPSSYQMKDAKDQQFYDGFIAQDVEKIFPNLIYHNVGMDKKEVLSMNYSGFGVIAIKGIQELQDKIQVQQDQINSQQKQIDDLKTMMNKLAPGQFQNVTTGSLEQNSPNPAKSATSIGYSIPTNNGSAQLQIIDNLGRTVKSIQLTSSGRINLDLSSLSSGTYTYSLVVDGKVVETKKLVKASE